MGFAHWRWVLVAVAVLAAACGEDNAQTIVAPPGDNNTPPTISGAPAKSVNQDTSYMFVPSASDADGDPLTFGIDAKPAWATFDTATGQLSGRPVAGDVGVFRGIAIWVSDGKAKTSLPTFDLTVMAAAGTVNHAPTISGTPPPSVVAGSAYVFTPNAADADGDTLSFSISNRPAWATFSTANGRLQGTPQIGNVGSFDNIVISVSDGQSTVAMTAFSVVVTAPAGNSPPVISGAPLTSVEAGTLYAFVPSASDPDNDTLTFSVSGLPSWATFDAQTGRLSGTPPAAGTFGSIVIGVSDGLASATLAPFTITVTAPTTNTPPTISGTPPTSATEGVQYVFQPSAADADGDTLTWSIANRPTWATFNMGTGRLQGTPGSGDVRTFSNIVISVSDGQATVSLPAFAIAVAGANNPPTITGSPSTTATVGTQYTFTPTANDPDGDTLTFSITNKPSWATFNASTGRLSGTPATGDIGTTSAILIGVSDGQASAQLATFSIVVSAAPNQPPTISGSPPSSAVQGSVYSFTPTANDPDGDTLTFSITNMPTWATFSTSTGQLQGTPGVGDVGMTTSGIVITVSDGTASASLAPFDVTVQAVATGSATLSWTSPTQNDDGSPLTDLAGFKVYWGTSEGSYPNSVTLDNPGLTTYVVDNLISGNTYFFVTTAFNSTGDESNYSNVASKTIP